MTNESWPPEGTRVDLLRELEATRLEMERAYTDYSRLNYDWLARCISVVSRAEQALKRHEIEVIDGEH